MTEYALCPGVDDMSRPCGSLVKIIGNDTVKMCCKPCWETTWGQIQAALLEADYVPGGDEFGHSRECDLRQRERRGFSVVTDREFKTAGPDGGIPGAPATQ